MKIDRIAFTQRVRMVYVMKKLIDMIVRSRIRKGILISLALLVTFVSTYTLVLPAITLENSVASSLPGLVMSRSESRGEASASAEKDGDDGSESAAVPGGTVENDAGGTTLCFDGDQHVL